MSDLISRQLLKDWITGHCDIELHKDLEDLIVRVIDDQPVAYDVKAIIEQLEDERQDVLAMADESDYFLGQLALLNRVIPLLKGAGKDV